MFALTLLALLGAAYADITHTTVHTGDCVCATTTVNARSAAGTSASVVTQLSNGDCGKIHGGILTKDGYKWYEIDYNGRRMWVAGNYLRTCGTSSGGSSSGGGSACRTNHGNVMNLHPTGMASGGVSASKNQIEYDISRLNQDKAWYEAAADANCVQASVIAALASRESHAGRLLESTGGYGDHGHAWGIMQCDLFTSGLDCKKCPWKSLCHINMLVKEKLVPDMAAVQRRHPTWSKEQCLQGAISAYNAGLGNVQTWSGLDRGTTGNDYSNDVVARAQYLVTKYGWN